MQDPSRLFRILLLVAVLLIALNLRPALASVGPLVEDIRAATGLSSSRLGLLTTLPLLAFGVISTLTPLLTRRFGIGRTLVGAMGLLAAGAALRGTDSLVALFAGTLLVGIAIALGNVLLPTLTKRNFAARSGLVTSLYSSVMGLGAALAAGVSVPLAVDLGLGWRGSLAVWAAPAALACIAWIPLAPRFARSPAGRSFAAAVRHLGGSKLAWSVALFMGLQSMTFYVVLAWLPAILISRGADASHAGWMLSLSQAMGILGSLILPTWAGRYAGQRGFVLILTGMEIASLVGLMIGNPFWSPLWVSLIGFVLGGSFGLALLFIVVRAHHTETATELSGMAQSIGYSIAACGPPIFGALFDYRGDWLWAFLFLLMVAAVKLAAGFVAGTNALLDPADA